MWTCIAWISVICLGVHILYMLALLVLSVYDKIEDSYYKKIEDRYL